jgi:hypothetical protein
MSSSVSATSLVRGGGKTRTVPVARHLQVAVGFLIDLTELAQQGMHIVPPEIVRDGMLEDRVVGAQVRAGE